MSSTINHHHQFGKMAEGTNHWNTSRHPAFKKLHLGGGGNGGKKSSSTVSSMSILNSLIEKDSTTNVLSEPNLWVITEKVHGSNMSFVVDLDDENTKNIRVRCAKREDFLDDNNPEDNSTFFGYLKVKKQLEDAAKKAFATVGDVFFAASSSTKNNIKRITIYGELFGGTFPGLASPPDVKMPVQDGLFYSPDLHFICFDLRVDVLENDRTKTDDEKGKRSNDDDDDDDEHQHQSTDNSKNTKTTRLPFLQSMKFLHDCGFPLVSAPLAVGSFEDCCNYNIDFTTTIPDRLGDSVVPKDAKSAIAGKNKAEGIVCRTNVPQEVPILKTSSSSEILYDKCMFKRKQDNFAQWCDSRAKNTSGSRQQQSGDEKTAVLSFIEDEFLTKEIVLSAMSKTGRPKDPNIDCKIMTKLKMFVLNDVLEGLDGYLCPAFYAKNTSSQQDNQKKNTKNGNKKGAAAATSASASAVLVAKSSGELFELYDSDITSLVAKKCVEFLTAGSK